MRYKWKKIRYNKTSKRNFVINNLKKVYKKVFFAILLLITKEKFIYIDIKANTKVNSIHIGLSMDKYYFYPCIVLIASLLDNKAKSSFYNIHILFDKSIDDNFLGKINSTIYRLGENSVNVIFHKMGDDFNNYPTPFLPKSILYRLSLSSLLPDIDKIIYIDSDVLNFRDLSEMYNIELKDDIYYCGQLDHVNIAKEINRLRIYPEKYINSGIIIINLKAIRKDSVEEKIKKFILKYHLRFPDQGAINAICHNNTQILPYKYSRFAHNSFQRLIILNNEQKEKYRLNESELMKEYSNPTLIHFAGRSKPWNKNFKNILGLCWLFYAKKSGLFQEILNHYGFNLNNIEEKLSNITKDGVLVKKNCIIY